MNLPPCEPFWALPAAIGGEAVLLLLLIPLLFARGQRPPEVDPHDEPYGDQPQVPL